MFDELCHMVLLFQMCFLPGLKEVLWPHVEDRWTVVWKQRAALDRQLPYLKTLFLSSSHPPFYLTLSFRSPSSPLSTIPFKSLFGQVLDRGKNKVQIL